MKTSVDQDTCISCGVCVSMCPDIYQFNDDDKSGNLIGLIIGACLLLGCLDVIEFEIIWKLMVPFILVIGTICLQTAKYIMYLDFLGSIIKRQLLLHL